MNTPSARLRAFGARLRKFRENKKLTQESLASKTGLHATYISGLENGKRNPSLNTLDNLASTLNIKVSDLTD